MERTEVVLRAAGQAPERSVPAAEQAVEVGAETLGSPWGEPVDESCAVGQLEDL